MAHGNAREGKWTGNWRMEWVASTLHTTSEHGVSSITTADAHTSAASSPLNWCPCRFKWTRPFRRKTKSGFCACANTFQPASTNRRCLTSQKSDDLINIAAEAWNHGVKYFTVAVTSPTSTKRSAQVVLVTATGLFCFKTDDCLALGSVKTFFHSE